MVLLLFKSFHTRTLQHQLQDILQHAMVPESARLCVHTADWQNQLKGTCLAQGDHNAQGPRDGDAEVLSVALPAPPGVPDPAAQDPAVLPTLLQCSSAIQRGETHSSGSN